MAFFVYTITNTITSEVYVGKTNDLARRWRIHRYFGSTGQFRGRSHLYANMRTYGLDAFEFKCVYHTSNEEDSYAHEIETISSLKKSGVMLLNLTSGGDGVRGITAHQKKLISDRFKALWKDSSFRLKMKSKVRKLRGHQTEETKQRISSSLKKNWASDEEKAKQRIENLREIFRSDEFRLKASIKQKEVQQRVEVKQKIAAARIKRNDHLRATVNDLRSDYQTGLYTQKDLAKKYDLRISQVKGIIAGNIYRYLIDQLFRIF